MKKIVILSLMFVLSVMIFAEDSYQGINSKVIGYRVSVSGFWFSFENKPNDIESGNYRMHAFISIDQPHYKEMVATLILAHTMGTPIKFIFYNDSLIDSHDVLNIYMIEI